MVELIPLTQVLMAAFWSLILTLMFGAIQYSEYLIASGCSQQLFCST